MLEEDSFQLTCVAIGDPPPTIIWCKDDIEFQTVPAVHEGVMEETIGMKQEYYECVTAMVHEGNFWRESNILLNIMA